MGCVRQGRSLTGAWIETRWTGRAIPTRIVAPSRERGSKLERLAHGLGGRRSLPHGSVDRNSAAVIRRCTCVASLPHGSVDRNRMFAKPFLMAAGRSLTGAWIETSCWHGPRRRCSRRSLTGAWIETRSGGSTDGRARVAPSRERGSKQQHCRAFPQRRRVSPSRERGLKHDVDVCTNRAAVVASLEELGSQPCHHNFVAGQPVAASQGRGFKLHDKCGLPVPIQRQCDAWCDIRPCDRQRGISFEVSFNQLRFEKSQPQQLCDIALADPLLGCDLPH